MKRIFLLSVVLTLFIASFGQTSAYYRVQNAGGSVSIAASSMAKNYYVYSSGAVTLGAPYSISYSATPPAGQAWTVYVDVTSTTVGVHSITIFGQTLNADQLATPGYFCFISLRNHSTTAVKYTWQPVDFTTADILDGGFITDGTVPLAKLENATRGRILRTNSSQEVEAYDAAANGRILIGDGSDINSVAQSGDVIFSNAGVSAIQAGVIVNADVNASADIARSKIAAGTASHVIINDGSGYFTSEATLSPSRGGLGTNASAATGFVTFSGGATSIGAVSESQTFLVSFDTLELSDNKVLMPCDGTVTSIYAYVTKNINAGGTSATITPKNNAGTTMTSGTITFSAGDVIGTAVTSTPSANNTFSAGDILYFTTAKTNAGGKALVTFIYTRND